MDLFIVKIVLNWVCTRIITEIKNFLGLGSYYEQFVENFSRIAGPKTRMTRKDVSFMWDSKCKDELKQRLTSALVLVVSSLDVMCTICMDTFRGGLDCTLI